MMEAVLLPFRDKIITDGLVIPYNIVFGRGAAADFKDVYMDAAISAPVTARARGNNRTVTTATALGKSMVK